MLVDSLGSTTEVQSGISIVSFNLASNTFFVLLAEERNHGQDNHNSEEPFELAHVADSWIHGFAVDGLGEAFNAHAPGAAKGEFTLDVGSALLIVGGDVDVGAFILADASVF